MCRSLQTETVLNSSALFQQTLRYRYRTLKSCSHAEQIVFALHRCGPKYARPKQISPEGIADVWHLLLYHHKLHILISLEAALVLLKQLTYFCIKCLVKSIHLVLIHLYM